MDELFQTNYLAVFIAAIVNMVIGATWYGPKFLGDKWLEVHAFDRENLKAGPLSYLGAFIIGLIIATVFGAFLSFFKVTSIIGAMCFAFFIWLGFIATTQFSGVIWAKKPVGAYCIDVGFFLVSLQAMAVIFGLFY
ncbi:MAG: DUF1761 domain-containing protein [Chlamydiota bacterium]|nr:DUF1761 domain-containing protein [Chlamydiota bacterium]